MRNAPAGVEPVPTATMLENRLALQRKYLPAGEKPVLTLVFASGGGIQASAWTVQVLSGLQETLGDDFTRSIYLVSAVSGGSVGTMFFLDSIDPRTGAVPEGRVDCLNDAARESSLEETAWGIAFPDLLRVFFPVVKPTLDRGWALEQAWQSHLGSARCTTGLGRAERPPAGERLLSDWMTGAEKGYLPGAVFNSTVVEGGRQLLFSNLALEELKLEVNPRYDRRLTSLAPGDPALDLPVTTAARLSATFPYIVPFARATRADGETPPEDLPAWHFADGGYFDNFGVMTTVEWLRALQADHGDLRNAFTGHRAAGDPRLPRAEAEGSEEGARLDLQPDRAGQHPGRRQDLDPRAAQPARAVDAARAASGDSPGDLPAPGPAGRHRAPAVVAPSADRPRCGRRRLECAVERPAARASVLHLPGRRMPVRRALR